MGVANVKFRTSENEYLEAREVKPLSEQTMYTLANVKSRTSENEYLKPREIKPLSVQTMSTDGFNVYKARWRHAANFSNDKYLVTSTRNLIRGNNRAIPVNSVTLWNLTTFSEDEWFINHLAGIPLFDYVTEIQFINYTNLVASDSSGTVQILVCDESSTEININTTWPCLHNDSACTALSIYGQNIITAGGDGKMNLLELCEENIARTIIWECKLNCVDFLQHNEILAGDIKGRMTLWDLRSDQMSASATNFRLFKKEKLSLMQEVKRIAHHPTQRHKVVVGYEDGSLAIWDLRNDRYPIGHLKTHSRSVSEILFHKHKPDNLFTSSMSGELWHWSNFQQMELQLGAARCNDHRSSISLKDLGIKTSPMSVYNSFPNPITSIDIDNSTILCGYGEDNFSLIENINL